MSIVERLRRVVLRRRGAYRAVFKPGGLMTPAALIVLSDLRRFCRATVSTTMVSPVTRQVDPYASAQAEGRREVFNRIAGMIHVSDEDLYKLLDQEEQES